MGEVRWRTISSSVSLLFLAVILGMVVAYQSNLCQDSGRNSPELLQTKRCYTEDTEINHFSKHSRYRRKELNFRSSSATGERYKNHLNETFLLKSREARVEITRRNHVLERKFLTTIKQEQRRFSKLSIPPNSDSDDVSGMKGTTRLHNRRADERRSKNIGKDTEEKNRQMVKSRMRLIRDQANAKAKSSNAFTFTVQNQRHVRKRISSRGDKHMTSQEQERMLFMKRTSHTVVNRRVLDGRNTFVKRKTERKRPRIEKRENGEMFSVARSNAIESHVCNNGNSIQYLPLVWSQGQERMKFGRQQLKGELLRKHFRGSALNYETQRHLTRRPDTLSIRHDRKHFQVMSINSRDRQRKHPAEASRGISDGTGILNMKTRMQLSSSTNTDVDNRRNKVSVIGTKDNRDLNTYRRISSKKTFSGRTKTSQGHPFRSLYRFDSRFHPAEQSPDKERDSGNSKAKFRHPSRKLLSFERIQEHHDERNTRINQLSGGSRDSNRYAKLKRATSFYTNSAPGSRNNQNSRSTNSEGHLRYTLSRLNINDDLEQQAELKIMNIGAPIQNRRDMNVAGSKGRSLKPSLKLRRDSDKKGQCDNSVRRTRDNSAVGRIRDQDRKAMQVTEIRKAKISFRSMPNNDGDRDIEHKNSFFAISELAHRRNQQIRIAEPEGNSKKFRQSNTDYRPDERKQSSGQATERTSARIGTRRRNSSRILIIEQRSIDQSLMIAGEQSAKSKMENRRDNTKRLTNRSRQSGKNEIRSLGEQRQLDFSMPSIERNKTEWRDKQHVIPAGRSTHIVRTEQQEVVLEFWVSPHLGSLRRSDNVGGRANKYLNSPVFVTLEREMLQGKERQMERRRRLRERETEQRSGSMTGRKIKRSRRMREMERSRSLPEIEMERSRSTSDREMVRSRSMQQKERKRNRSQQEREMERQSSVRESKIERSRNKSGRQVERRRSMSELDTEQRRRTREREMKLRKSMREKETEQGERTTNTPKKEVERSRNVRERETERRRNRSVEGKKIERSRCVPERQVERSRSMQEMQRSGNAQNMGRSENMINADVRQSKSMREREIEQNRSIRKTDVEQSRRMQEGETERRSRSMGQRETERSRSRSETEMERSKNVRKVSIERNRSMREREMEQSRSIRERGTELSRNAQETETEWRSRCVGERKMERKRNTPEIKVERRSKSEIEIGRRSSVSKVEIERSRSIGERENMREREMERSRSMSKIDVERNRSTREREMERSRSMSKIDVERSRRMPEREMERSRNMREIKMERSRSTSKIDIERSRSMRDREMERNRNMREREMGRSKSMSKIDIEPSRSMREREMERSRSMSKIDIEPSRSMREREMERSRNMKEREMERSKNMPEREMKRSRSMSKIDTERGRIMREREMERSRNMREREMERSKNMRERETERSRNMREREMERSKNMPEREMERSRSMSKIDTERSRSMREREMERNRNMREREMERSRSMSKIDIEPSRIMREREMTRSSNMREKEMERSRSMREREIERSRSTSESEVKRSRSAQEMGGSKSIRKTDVKQSRSMQQREEKRSSNIRETDIEQSRSIQGREAGRRSRSFAARRMEQIEPKRKVEQNKSMLEIDTERSRDISEREMERSRNIREREMKQNRRIREKETEWRGSRISGKRIERSRSIPERRAERSRSMQEREMKRSLIIRERDTERSSRGCMREREMERSKGMRESESERFRTENISAKKQSRTSHMWKPYGIGSIQAQREKRCISSALPFDHRYTHQSEERQSTLAQRVKVNSRSIFTIIRQQNVNSIIRHNTLTSINTAGMWNAIQRRTQNNPFCRQMMLQGKGNKDNWEQVTFVSDRKSGYNERTYRMTRLIRSTQRIRSDAAAAERTTQRETIVKKANRNIFYSSFSVKADALKMIPQRTNKLSANREQTYDWNNRELQNLNQPDRRTSAQRLPDRSLRYSMRRQLPKQSAQRIITNARIHEVEWFPVFDGIRVRRENIENKINFRASLSSHPEQGEKLRRRRIISNQEINRRQRVSVNVQTGYIEISVGSAHRETATSTRRRSKIIFSHSLQEQRTDRKAYESAGFKLSKIENGRDGIFKDRHRPLEPFRLKEYRETSRREEKTSFARTAQMTGHGMNWKIHQTPRGIFTVCLESGNAVVGTCLENYQMLRKPLSSGISHLSTLWSLISSASKRQPALHTNVMKNIRQWNNQSLKLETTEQKHAYIHSSFLEDKDGLAIEKVEPLLRYSQHTRSASEKMLDVFTRSTRRELLNQKRKSVLKENINARIYERGTSITREHNDERRLTARKHNNERRRERLNERRTSISREHNDERRLAATEHNDERRLALRERINERRMSIAREHNDKRRMTAREHNDERRLASRECINERRTSIAREHNDERRLTAREYNDERRLIARKHNNERRTEIINERRTSIPREHNDERRLTALEHNDERRLASRERISERRTSIAREHNDDRRLTARRYNDETWLASRERINERRASIPREYNEERRLAAKEQHNGERRLASRERINERRASILKEHNGERNLAAREHKDERRPASGDHINESGMSIKKEHRSERRKLADISERRKLADITERRKLADISDRRKLADISERRRSVIREQINERRRSIRIDSVFGETEEVKDRGNRPLKPFTKVELCTSNVRTRRSMHLGVLSTYRTQNCIGEQRTTRSFVFTRSNRVHATTEFEIKSQRKASIMRNDGRHMQKSNTIRHETRETLETYIIYTRRQRVSGPGIRTQRRDIHKNVAAWNRHMHSVATTEVQGSSVRAEQLTIRSLRTRKEREFRKMRNTVSIKQRKNMVMPLSKGQVLHEESQLEGLLFALKAHEKEPKYRIRTQRNIVLAPTRQNLDQTRRLELKQGWSNAYQEQGERALFKEQKQGKHPKGILKISFMSGRRTRRTVTDSPSFRAKKILSRSEPIFVGKPGEKDQWRSETHEEKMRKTSPQEKSAIATVSYGQHSDTSLLSREDESRYQIITTGRRIHSKRRISKACDSGVVHRFARRLERSDSFGARDSESTNNRKGSLLLKASNSRMISTQGKNQQEFDKEQVRIQTLDSASSYQYDKYGYISFQILAAQEEYHAGARKGTRTSMSNERTDAKIASSCGSSRSLSREDSYRDFYRRNKVKNNCFGLKKASEDNWHQYKIREQAKEGRSEITAATKSILDAGKSRWHISSLVLQICIGMMAIFQIATECSNKGIFHFPERSWLHPVPIV